MQPTCINRWDSTKKQHQTTVGHQDGSIIPWFSMMFPRMFLLDEMPGCTCYISYLWYVENMVPAVESRWSVAARLSGWARQIFDVQKDGAAPAAVFLESAMIRQSKCGWSVQTPTIAGVLHILTSYGLFLWFVVDLPIEFSTLQVATTW